MVRRCRVFGLPEFVLNPNIQEGKNIPQWKSKSNLAHFLGHSKIHLSVIFLVINIFTGFFFTKYHVVCNYFFTKVFSEAENQ